jgi:predicted metal-dependent hydrolase
MNQTLLPERRLIESIPVEVRRSSRRRTRLGLAFDPTGYVIVEAPMDATVAEIRSVIRAHRRWLRSRLDKVVDSAGLSACLSYAAGERLHYLGDPYELSVKSGRHDDVQLKPRQGAVARQLGLFGAGPARGRIQVTLRRHRDGDVMNVLEDIRVRALVADWYRREAEACFAAELVRWRRRLPWLRGRVPEWRHRFMRSQWGSCSLSGRISLNTHLVKTPPRLIAYVTLHELCHLQHYDHSRRFYALMGRYMPDWEARRTELDQYLPVLLQD